MKVMRFNQKKIRMYLYRNKHRVLFSFIAVIVVFMTAYLLYSYYNAKRNLYAEIDNRLKSAALMTDVIMQSSTQDVTGIVSPSADGYMNTVTSLNRLAASLNVMYVYTLCQKDGRIYFTASNATAKELETGTFINFLDPYPDASDACRRAFGARSFAFDEYTDQWGTFRSIFVPRVFSKRKKISRMCRH